jgi:hypothetical protein
MTSLFSVRLDQSMATIHETTHAPQSAKIVYSGVIEIPPQTESQRHPPYIKGLLHQALARERKAS